MSAIKRCPICKREKNKAVHEQTQLKVGCGIEGCVFAKEITKSIKEKTKINIIKKQPKKLRIIKKQ